MRVGANIHGPPALLWRSVQRWTFRPVWFRLRRVRRYWLSLKCSPERFAELAERPWAAPAPYLARAHWIALEHPGTLPAKEVEDLIRSVHAIVFRNLPKNTRTAMGPIT
jgi:predicted DNA-binding protein (MmcQ/YjbR family)